METADNASLSDKNPASVSVARGAVTGAVLLSIALMALCLALLAATNSLRLGQAASDLIFRILYLSAIGFTVSAAARFFLDIMYGILGLLQVKVVRLMGWLALALLSYAPLGAIFAFMRLASGFQA